MKNPGAAWHTQKEREARAQERAASKRWQQDFFHGKATAHLESALAAKAMRMNPRRPPKRWFKSCVRQVRRRSKVAAPQAVCGALWYRKMGKGAKQAALKRERKNPIAIYGLGNPGSRINAAVEGVIYNRVVEIRAEKTGYKPGLYRHPFSRAAKVCLLALDNGDILVHSRAGKKLWKVDR